MASGTTRWRSNLSPHTTGSSGEQLLNWYKIQGTKVVSASVNATNIKANTKLNAPAVVGTTYVQATSYIKLGTSQYLFFGTKQTAATIIANATALVGGTIAGSLYLSNGGKPGLFVIQSTSVASRLEGY